MQTPAARNSSLGRGSGPAASAASTILPKTTRTTSATPTTANLYQRCLDLEAELRTEQRVPGFSRYLDRAEESTRQSRTATTFTPSARPDPVTLLWTCLRMGGSLCHLVNVIRPGSIAESAVNEGINASGAPSSANQAKASVYYFLLACRNTLHVDDADLFAIGDLYRDDTNGFIRVLHTVELLLDRIPKSTISAAAQQPSHDSTGSGTLHREQSVAMSTRSRSRSPDKKIRHDSTSQRVPVTSGSPQATSATPRRSIRHSMDAKTHREKVLMEMVETERKYVADLERMQVGRGTVVHVMQLPLTKCTHERHLQTLPRTSV